MKTYCIDWFEQELCECDGSEGYLVRTEDHERVVEELQSRLESLEQEMQEQARIIGMGAEREDRLMARVRELESLDKDAQNREDVARAIWNVMREYEDRCDMELEDMGMKHPIWEYADAAMQANKGE